MGKMLRREKMLGIIVSSMREYQKINNIEKECVTNTSFLYDNIHSYCNAKTKAVICFTNELREAN